MDALIEFGKILIPSALVLYAVYLTVRSFITKEIELKKLEVRTRSIETILPARLQAYERMTLFLERIAPQNLLIRLNSPGFTARGLLPANFKEYCLMKSETNTITMYRNRCI